jgi:hypothetical protein
VNAIPPSESAPESPPESNGYDSKTKANRRRLMLIGVALAAVSLFMYVSFILKTAIKGP